MSGSYSGRTTRQSSKKNRNDTPIENETLVKKAKTVTIFKTTPQPDTTPLPSIAGPSKPLDTTLNFNFNQTLANSTTQTQTSSPANETNNSNQSGKISDSNSMEVDTSSNPTNPKGKNVENTSTSTFGNFTRPRNFTLIADFSAISENISKPKQRELIDLRCASFPSYDNNRVATYPGKTYTSVYFS